MANEWSGVITDNAPRYLKGVTDLTIRDRLLLSMLRKRGRITYGHSSHTLHWNVQRMQNPVETYNDGATINYSRQDQDTRLELDVRGYRVSDMMTAKEQVMNQGATAIINRYKEKIPRMVQSMRDRFGTELYVDGYSAGNENALCGLNSFTGTGTTVAADLIAEPSDTYAGQSTSLGDAGGSWSTDLVTKPNAAVATDWPYGTGSSEYDYFSPKLVNWSSTNWGTSSTAWEDNAERVLRETISWLTLTVGKEGTPDLFLMSGEMYTALLNSISAKQRIIIPHKESQDLGFEAVNFDGVALHREYGIAPRTFYGLNLDQLEFCIWSSIDGATQQDQLFQSMGPTWDPHSASWLFLLMFFGNLKFVSPKYFAKGYSYA